MDLINSFWSTKSTTTQTILAFYVFYSTPKYEHCARSPPKQEFRTKPSRQDIVLGGHTVNHEALKAWTESCYHYYI